ncbi:hypothetical protein Bca101_060616 [Brassica carinata]
MAKRKPPKKNPPIPNSPSSAPLKVSVSPIEVMVLVLDSATVLDLPSVSLGNTDRDVTLSSSLSSELNVHLDLVTDVEPPSFETLATVSCVVPVVQENSIDLAAPASAEKVTIASSSDPEQTTDPSSSPEQAKSPAEIWKGFRGAEANSCSFSSVLARDSVPNAAAVASHSVLARDSIDNAAAVVEIAKTNEGPPSVSKDGATVTTVHDLNKGQLYVDLSGSPGFSLIASSSSGDSFSEMDSR